MADTAAPEPGAESGRDPSAPDLVPDLAASSFEVYLDFVDGTPRKGSPARFQARALTGNLHRRTGFVLDADIPFSGGGADSLHTVWKWSYAKGSVTFLEAGECRLKVAFQLVFGDGSFRIIDRELDFYVAR